MPDIRDLLRGAADDPSGPLDLDRVKARARQRTVRRRAGLIGAGAIAMVVIVLAGGLFLSGDDTNNDVVVGPTSTTLARTTDPEVVPLDHVTAVGLGAGSVWVGREPLAAAPGSQLVHIDPESFATVSASQVATGPLGIAVGRGGVWATGGGDGGVPDGMLARIDLGTQGMADPNLLVPPDLQSSPREITMQPDDSGDPYVWVAEQTQVFKIDSADNRYVTIPIDPAPTSLAVDADNVWVGTSGALWHIARPSLEPKATVVNATWVALSRIGLYGSTNDEVFTVDGSAVMAGTSAATPLRVRGVGGKLAADPQGDGVWVADNDGVKYVRPMPTTGTPSELGVVEGRQLLGVQARDLVSDGTYVWIVTDAGQLLRWRPPPG